MMLLMRYSVAIAIVTFSISGLSAQKQQAIAKDSTPVRIVIKPESSTVHPGEKTTVKVTLEDASGKEVKATKDYVITLRADDSPNAKQGPRPATPPVTQSVTIKPGNESAKTELHLPDNGVYQIKATHPELRDGGDFIQVRSKKTPSPPAAQKKGAATKKSQLWRPIQLASLLVLAPEFPEADERPRSVKPPIDLTIYTSHEVSKLVAGEPGLVTAYLADEAPLDLSVRFEVSAGKLTPNPIVIPKGASGGRAILDLESAGTVHLKAVGVQPLRIAQLNGDKDWDITFHPAIASLRVVPSPQSMPLGDTSLITVELLDHKKRRVATDEIKIVNLNLTRLAQLGSPSLTIKPGDYFAVTTVKSRELGALHVDAVTNGAATSVPADIDVTFPFGRLAVLAVGGMLGGLMWAWRTKAKGQVAFYAILGPFVALSLLWAIQANLIPKVHDDAVSNVLGIFVVSFLAGWGATEALTAVLRSAGFSTSQQGPA